MVSASSCVGRRPALSLSAIGKPKTAFTSGGMMVSIMAPSA
jgi:hypothetical protein